jgi:16S rRNA (cytosine967-C5)-methyltransferase
LRLRRNSLAVAIEALSWMAYARVGERTALFRAADQLDATTDELRQAHRLIMETTRFQNRMEYYVSLVSKAELNEMPHGVSAFLRILAFKRYVDLEDERQLRLAISSARQILGWKILRPYEETIGRLLSNTPQDFLGQNEFELISLETCHPAWYVQRILLLFGRDVGLQILYRDLKPIPIYIRSNPLRASSLRAHDVVALEVDRLRGVWRLRDSYNLGHQQLELVRTGKIVIQDLSSVVSCLVASPQPGNQVLDICAAPGNKTSHLAALMGNSGEIISVDSSRQRMAHWKKEIKRAGCSIANGLVADATKLELNVKAKVVFADPPCSNTGVFAKNPAMKWRLSPARLQSLIMKQSAILASASKHVQEGGSLVYSTCSILPEENEDVIASFLHTNPDFTLEMQTPFLGSPGLKGFSRCQRFFPYLHECNGYFIAKFRRA